MTALPECSRVYVTPVCDSSRWTHFKPREGDIIVCTPPKCGTTWTQMICGLLVHGEGGLPKPLTQLSRWLDRHTIPIEEQIAELESQAHRRIIKTHTPLDGQPYFPEVRYIFCGRDPRDAFLSFIDHLHNVSPHAMTDINRRMGLPEDQQMAVDANELFPLWATTGNQPWAYDGAPFGLPMLYMVESYWRFRHLPNLLFLHYADLTRDLDGEMRRVAAFLDIAVDEAEWPALVAAASFAGMKDKAQETAPDADLGEWSNSGDFFRAARMEAWRNGLSAENQALYETVNAERVDPEMKAWAEQGRGAAA
jgi:hypothetical protein